MDLFLFDVKVIDPARHRLLTGVANDMILDTLTALAARSAQKVILRVPLVPGFTDDRAGLEAIAGLATRLRLSAINVVPYHPLGRDKYMEVGLPAPRDVASLEPAMVAAALALFARHGLQAEVA